MMSLDSEGVLRIGMLFEYTGTGLSGRREEMW